MMSGGDPFTDCLRSLSPPPRRAVFERGRHDSFCFIATARPAATAAAAIPSDLT